MKKLYTFTIFLSLLSACNYTKNVRLLSGGELTRTDFVEAIPFTYKKDLIVVRARINNDTTLREFIFDTGAFNSKIEFELAEKLALENIATKSNSTAQGNTQDIYVTRIDKIQLGETIFSTISAGKLRYAPNSASKCIAEAGIIGANLIQLAHWKIDYKNQMIYFSDRPFDIKQGKSYTLSFKKPLLSGVPEIQLEIDGQIVENILFDVGYNGGLILPQELSNNFKSAQETKIIDNSTSGIYGSNIDTLITKDLVVNLGGLESRVPVEFSSIGKALIGNDFLEHFNVIINYDDKTITLEPYSKVEIDPSLDFIPGILNDSLWVVNRIKLPSSLNLGDTLSLVNGFKPIDLYDSYCDYIHNIRGLLNTDSITYKKNSRCKQR